MKKVILLLLVVFINVGEAKVWRVDNNATNKPDFTNLQLAHDGASAGDTICIAGHANSYGSLNISKQIVIIGSGYFSEQNLEKGVNPFDVRIDQIVFSYGAENSIVMSCTIGSALFFCKNIILKRNIMSQVETREAGLSGIIIQQNFIRGQLALAGDNFRVCNNILNTLSVSSSGLIKNNVICNNGNSVSINGVLFENNIFGPGYKNFSNSLGRNNVEYGDANTIFQNTGNEDAKYILKEGSPAKGAGVNGVDCGIFGGDEPYILSGIPPIPTIYEAIVPSTVTNKDGLPIKIKAKANN